MKALIHLQVEDQSGSLERILRVARHRGFQVTNLNVSAVPEMQCFDVTLRVESERHLPLLTRQLKKLINVTKLNVLDGLSYAKTA